MSYYNNAKNGGFKNMSDNDTGSVNAVISKTNSANKRFTPLTITLFVIALLIVGLLIARFVTDKSNSNKVKTALANAQIYNGHNQPQMALDQLNQIQGIKIDTSDQETVLAVKVSAYSELNDYTQALENAEKAYKLVPTDVSLLSGIAQLAQSNNDTRTATTYYQKLVVAMGKIPSNQRGITYAANLAEIQAQLKQLSNQ
jgi:tetratricopeptide (TPR) repeat protein